MSTDMGEPGENEGGKELDVSIIIPCLNEERTVGECVIGALSWLQRSGMAGEVVVVDNASTDETAAMAAGAGARVVAEPRPGKGNAVRTGVRETRGRYVIMSDGDATYDLSDLNPIVDPLLDGYDMVIGNRLTGEMVPGAMPRLHRAIGNPMFNWLIGTITGQRMGDVLSGLRGFTRQAWTKMRPSSQGFELESEMCLRAGRNKLRVKDVPITYSARREPSKLRGLTHGWAIARFVILESADLIFIYPGILAVLLGIVSLVIGVAASEGVDVGSVRWQPVFAGGILVPGGIAFITVGVAAKWLAWRRGVAPAGRTVRLLADDTVPVGDYFLLAGIAWLLSGIVLDVYLLAKWTADDPPPLALGLGAVAQTLVVAGLNLVVAAVLIDVLRVQPRPDSGQEQSEEQL